MRWEQFVTISVSSLLLLYVLFWSVIYAFLYENVEPSFLKNVIVVAVYIAIFTAAVRAIAKSRQAKLTYLLFAQYVLLLAVVSVTQDIFRGWYAWVKGYSSISIGYYSEAMDPKVLYDDIGLLYTFLLPVPEWNWSLLLGISVLLLLLALGWFVKTVRTVRLLANIVKIKLN